MTSLDAAWDIVRSTGPRPERQALRDDVPRFGFKSQDQATAICSRSPRSAWCCRMLDCGGAAGSIISAATKAAILEPLERIIEAGRSPAEEMLEKFNGPWKGSVEPAYQEYAF
jgi:glutamate--cysteine ligase